jgi:hypothetical protein
MKEFLWCGYGKVSTMTWSEQESYMNILFLLREPLTLFGVFENFRFKVSSQKQQIMRHYYQ